MLSPQSDVVLMIEKPAAGGRMLARHEGQVVFVSGAIPGERVRARIERVTRQLAFADTVEVLEASPDRREGALDLLCGGSVYAHIDYPRQLVLKADLARDAFGRIAKMTLPDRIDVMPSPEDGYRMRARLHVHEGRTGFFREGTHELCDAAPTRQLLPATLETLRRLERELVAQGTVSALMCEIAENVAADQRVVSVQFGSGAAWPKSLTSIEGITGVEPGGYGSPYVSDTIDLGGTTLTLRHHVQSFFQSNRFLLRDLIERVVRHVAEGPVVDLYAGVGLFSLALAALGRQRIIAVEGDRHGAEDLLANAGDYAGAVSVKHVAVEKFLGTRSPESAQTVLVDPPRTGLSGEALTGIAALKPPRIVYVSCDLATLARDVRRFVEAGYALEHVEAFDLFPNTAHVETLAVLTR